VGLSHGAPEEREVPDSKRQRRAWVTSGKVTYARFDFIASGCRERRLREERGGFSSNDSAGAAEFTTVSLAAAHGALSRYPPAKPKALQPPAPQRGVTAPGKRPLIRQWTDLRPVPTERDGPSPRRSCWCFFARSRAQLIHNLAQGRGRPSADGRVRGFVPASNRILWASRLRQRGQQVPGTKVLGPS
jgi:hypothetical protein